MEALRQLIRIFTAKKILLTPESMHLLRSLTEEEVQNITSIIQDLPERDVLIISHDLERFIQLAKNLDADTFYQLKTRLLVKHGKKLYDDYLTLLEQEAKSISLILLKQHAERKEKKTREEDNTARAASSSPHPVTTSTSHSPSSKLPAHPSLSSLTQHQSSPIKTSQSHHSPPTPLPSEKTRSSPPSTPTPSHHSTPSIRREPLSPAQPSTSPAPSSSPDEKTGSAQSITSIMSRPETASPDTQRSSYTLVKTPHAPGEKRDLKAFISMLTHRYQRLRELILQRPDVQGVLPVRRVLTSRDDEARVIIMIRDLDRREDRITLLAEDEHDQLTIRIRKNDDQKLWEEAQELTEDDVIYVEGVMRNGTLYAKRILHPDIPLGKELPRSPLEEYAVFISDLQYGSIDFLQPVFERFLAWLEGRDPDQRLQAIARRVRYLFIVGDLLDGIGIYPKQYEELTVKSVRGQFTGAAELLKRIPAHIDIFIIPGNHDPVRLAEPQHPFHEKHAESLYRMGNVHILPNPSWVRIGVTNGFPGITILLYHGYSFDYYANDIPLLHEAGGYDNPVKLMSYLLKRRHLAPNYKSTLVMPGEEDHLIIDPIPDVFAAGHIHRTRVGQYRNILLLEAGCWQGMTPYMEKTGHIPEPGKAIVLPLHTMKPIIIDFLGEEDIHHHA